MAKKSDGEGCHVLELYAENVQCIRTVSIKTKGKKEIIIGGGNGEGKSSTINCIAWAIGGEKLIPAVPVRKGQDSALIKLDLGELQVERTFRPDGSSSLKVTGKDGSRFSSPQAVLNRLMGDLSFDPMAFLRMKPKEQLESLKKIANVSFDDLNDEREEVFDQRKEINKEVSRLESVLAMIPKPTPDIPDKVISVADLSAELQRAHDTNQEADDLMDQATAAGAESIKARDALRAKHQELDDARKAVSRLEEEARQLSQSLDRAAIEEQRLSAMAEKVERVDPKPIIEKMQSSEKINARVRAKLDRVNKESEMKTQSAAAQRLTTRLGEIDQEKNDRLAAAKFPVKGLSFSEDEVLFKGVPFKQASKGEQTEVSMAMGMAQNPKLKVILIENGSLLDDEHLDSVIKLATRKGYQVWIERVSKGAECSIIIEDGEVVERR